MLVRREPAGNLDAVEDAIGRGEFAEASRVRSVRAVDLERRAVSAEDAVEQERLDGRDTEFVVDVERE